LKPAPNIFRRLWLRGPNFFLLRERGFHASRELINGAFTTDVHEIDARLIEEEMVVERRNRKAVIECRGHDRVHLVLEEHEVACDHDFLFSTFCEGSPAR
jgi:hypothetical protein